MKLSEMALKILSRYKYMNEITIYNAQRAKTPKVCEPELWLLCSAYRLMVVKFYEII